MTRAARLIATITACCTIVFVHAAAAIATGASTPDPAAAAPWIPALVIIICAWSLSDSVDRQPRLSLAVSVSAYACALVFAWWALQIPQTDDWHVRVEAQRAATMFVPVFAVAGLALATTHTLGGLARTRFRIIDRALAIDALVVTAWSFFVRLALTTPNILTDGGSGYRRLQEFMPGMTGLSMLLDLARGGRLAGGDMWSALMLPTVLAATAPLGVLLLAHAMGIGRRTARLAAMMLASLPIHAALYTSDFLTGSAVALSTFGLAALVYGVSKQRWQWLWPAALVLGFSIFVRPEAILIGVGVVAFGWPLWRRLATPAVAIPTAYLACVALIDIGILLQTGGPPGTHAASFPPVIPYQAWLSDQRMTPLWFIVPIPVGLWVLGRGALMAPRLAVAFVVVAATAAVPALRFAGDADPAGAPMEWPRYGTWFMPWAAMLAAAGVTRLADALPKPQIAYQLALAAVVATPVLASGYLATEYGYRRDEPVFRRALTVVPPDCRLIVPDDRSESQAGGSIEIEARYRFIAREVAATGQALADIVGITRAREELAAGGFQPDTCVYFYEGSFCHIGLRGAGTSVCRDFLASVDSEAITSERIDYRDHRLIVRPDLVHSGLIVPDMALTLHRIRPRT